MGLQVCELTMCEAHFEELRHQLDVRGLTPAISESGEELRAKVILTLLLGETSALTYDPLMHAYGLAMVMLAREALERGMLDDHLDGAMVCLVCEFLKLHEATCSNPECDARHAAGMFESVANFVLDYAQRHDVVSVPGS